MKIKIINGPNLNLLGIREKDIYGKKSYGDLINMISLWGEENNIEISFFQSNHEGELIDSIQDAFFNSYDGIVINPGGYSHTSVSIRDAISAVKIPTVEVHISDISKREDFRKFSYISDVCVKTIVGKGFDGYIEGLNYLLKYFN